MAVNLETNRAHTYINQLEDDVCLSKQSPVVMADRK